MDVKTAKKIFAAGMKISQTRRLTPRERLLLGKASQKIRYSRRTTAKNPKKPTLYTRASTEELQRVVKLYRQELLTSAILTPKEHRSLRSHIVAIQKELDRRAKPGAQKNPPKRAIYDRVVEIVCQRTAPHDCDEKCARVKHHYRHEFGRGAKIFGNPDGSVTIRSSR